MISHYVLAIDIGGTNTKVALVSKQTKRRILATSVLPTQDYATMSTFIEVLFNKTKELCQAQKVALSHVSGIGVGVPGGNYYRGSISHGINLPKAWGKNLPLAQLLSKKFSCPVVVDNDANIATLGEMMFGAGRKSKDFILVTLGTGVGCGVIANGQIIRGANGLAGELGHTTVIPNGRIHPRSKRLGSLESYVSNDGLVKTYQELKGEKQSEKITAEQISLAVKEDALAKKTIEEAGSVLGLALANAVLFVDPSLIVLAGGISRAGSLLIKSTQNSMNRHLISAFQEKTDVKLSLVPSDQVAILGAAALFLAEGRYR